MNDARRSKSKRKSIRTRRKAAMDCKEFMKLVPLWLDGRLDGKRGVKFLEHMENCKDCNEELHIQYLVREGTARLENGDNFNLDRELSDKVALYRKKLHRKHIENVIIYWMEAIAALAIVFILVLVFVKM